MGSPPRRLSETLVKVLVDVLEGVPILAGDSKPKLARFQLVDGKEAIADRYAVCAFRAAVSACYLRAAGAAGGIPPHSRVKGGNLRVNADTPRHSPANYTCNPSLWLSAKARTFEL